MPTNTKPNGTATVIPGVYTDTTVVSVLPGALPEFLTPVLIGAALMGIPYNVNSLREMDEPRLSPFVALGTVQAGQAAYGHDAEIVQALTVAKRNGLPFCWGLTSNALTRASVVVTSGSGAVEEFKLYPRLFGAPPGWHKILINGLDLKIVPLLRFSPIVVDANVGATRLYLASNNWVKIGGTLEVGSNTVPNVTYTVKDKGTELTSRGQIAYWVELTSPLGNDMIASDYALAAIYDDAHPEAPDTFADLQAMHDWVNGKSRFFRAVKVNWSGATPDSTVLAPLKEIGTLGTVVKGASPAQTSADWSNLISALDGSEWDHFIQDTKLVPQALCAATSDHDSHLALRDWALTKREEGYPVGVVTGVDWGDIDLGAGDEGDPTWRAAALNSQDIALVCLGIDKMASYLSGAPAVWAKRVKGGIGHNLTNDGILYSELEHVWDERNLGELTTLHKKGVVVARLSVGSGGRFVISQGLNTLQANESGWNTETGETCLMMQRDLADATSRAIKDYLENIQLGADEVDKDSAGAAVNQKGQQLIKNGWIKSFRIAAIELNATGTGWDVDWTVSLPVTTDFINVRTTILIGE